MRILLTGFEPNDDGLNASELVVRSIQENPPSELLPYRDLIECRVLPGNTELLGEHIYQMLDYLSPDICLLTGQARGYNKLVVERFAINLRFFVTLDRVGNAPKGLPVERQGAAAYLSSLPDLEQIISRLETENIPAAISNHGGTHLCNQSFYHALHFAHRKRPQMQVGFVHIPALPEQVIHYWPESPFMPKEMTRSALSLIILLLLVEDSSLNVPLQKVE